MFWLLGSIFLCALKSYAKLRKNAQMVNSVLLICSLLLALNPKYTDNLGL